MHVSTHRISAPAVSEINLTTRAPVSHAQTQRQPQPQGRTQPRERRRDGCTECRRKKVKCDLVTPVCSRCTRYPRECKYVSRFVAVTVGKNASSSESENMKQNMTVAPPTSISRIQAKMSIQTIVSETTTLVFPLASQTFLDRLFTSAMETPHLLFALLATSDSHARRRLPISNPENTTLNYTNNAIAGLRAALSDDRNSHRAVEMAMTAMALCTNDVCNGNIDLFRVHLAGVRGMLVSGLVSGRRDPLAMYLFKWFAALDVSAGLSLFHQSTLLSGELDRACRAAIAGAAESSRGAGGAVDDICGYSLDLLPILAEVGELARERYSKPNCPTLLERGEALESRIAALNNTPGQGLSEKETELHATHSAFIHTALLHLHRRVYHLPKTHSTVRTDILNILSAIRSVPARSTANILLLWPIFSAGCETDDADERALVDERMGAMQDLGMGNFTRARSVLNRFWAARTEVRWDVWLAREGVDLVLF
ncbi:fungal-specific transcription factor domain-containing protein [Aspergillus carlsbadensis]|nr:fungal-specific transcription factor domain-containing protein [Aspergillus carlsbadensis]